MHELSKEAKTNMPPDHIEQYYAEMSQRRMIGQLLLAIPVFSFVVWLI
jgi:flagellar biogenesis protein FliO